MKTITILLISLSLILSQKYSIGMVEWIGYAGNNVADTKGFWKDQGLDVEVKVFGTSSELHDAFKNGKIDIMHNVLATSLTHFFAGNDVVVVMQTGNSYGGDKVIIKRGISIKDLKGQDFLLYDDDPAVMLFLENVLKKKKLKISDFNYKVMEPVDAADKFISGSANLIMSYDPQSLRALRKGNGKILSSTKDFKASLAEGWIMHRAKLKSTPKKDLKKLFTGWAKAADWMNKKSNFKELFKILKSQTLPNQKIGFKEAKTMLSGIKVLDSGELESANKKEVVNYFKSLKEFLKKTNGLKKPFNPSYIVQTKDLLDAM